jgi:hypothetical protein
MMCNPKVPNSSPAKPANQIMVADGVLHRTSHHLENRVTTQMT